MSKKSEVSIYGEGGYEKMNVKIRGEGDQIYPVLAIDRWKVYTLGTDSGGVRTVGEDRIEVVLDTGDPDNQG